MSAVTGPTYPAGSNGQPGAGPGWGSAPQPLPAEPRRSSLNGALVVVVVMFGWLLVVYGLAAVVARNDPNVEIPAEIALGVVVTPADGWYSAEASEEVGSGRVVLRKSGAYVVFEVQEYFGTNEELMSGVLDDLSTEFGSFRAMPSHDAWVAGDLRGLAVYFTGSREGGQEEDKVVVASYKGIGLVMLAEAEAGQLSLFENDLDSMLRTLEVPR